MNSLMRSREEREVGVGVGGWLVIVDGSVRMIVVEYGERK